MENNIIPLHLPLERRKNTTPLCFFCCWGFAPHAPFVSLSPLLFSLLAESNSPIGLLALILPQKSQSVFNELCVCGSQPEAFQYWPVGISFSPLSSAYLLPLCFSLLIILSFRLIRNGAESLLLMFSKAFIYPSSFIPGEEWGKNKLHQSTGFKTSVIFCIINPYFTFVASQQTIPTGGLVLCWCHLLIWYHYLCLCEAGRRGGP